MKPEKCGCGHPRHLHDIGAADYNKPCVACRCRRLRRGGRSERRIRATSHTKTAHVVGAIMSRRFRARSENSIQTSLESVFKTAGLSFEREAPLEGGRVDFLVHEDGTRVAVEVKVGGSSAEAMRQLKRYSKEVDALVLVTTKASHRMPETLGGKPVTVVRPWTI